VVALAEGRTPYKILITDDDAGCRESVRDALATNGYETVEASCGREAIEVATQRLVHVLIVDMNMPDLSGVETVAIIRREVAPPPPSILMSADSSEEIMRRAMAAQFQSFLPKPLQLGILRHIVGEIIRRTYESDA